METSIVPEYGRARRVLVAAAAALLLAACATRPTTPDDAGAGMPYAGVAIGQDAEPGALVVDMLAGPAAQAGLVWGDRIVRVDGKDVDAARLLDILKTSSPGTRLALDVVREGRPLKVELVIGDLEQWASPARYPARVSFSPPQRAESTWLDDIEARVDGAAPELVPVAGRIDRMLLEVAEEARGYNHLALNRRALADPGSLIAWDRRLAEALSVADPRAMVVPVLCDALTIECPAAIADDAAMTLETFTASIREANAAVRDALPADRKQMLGDVTSLLQVTSTRRTLLDRASSQSDIRAMRYSLQVDSARLLDAFDRLLRNALHAPQAEARTPRKLPSALAAMVEGEILDFSQVDGGYVIVGGAGPNTYRMDRLYAVIDVGGDDRYVWNEAPPLETQTVIDLKGDDRYEADRGGPGAGWLGVAVLFDFAGDDRYTAALGGCGAGVYGYGMLFDASGDDVYRCNAWSVGAGIYGGGVLVDAAGADTYVSHTLSQGAGGPAGAGVLVDSSGSDLYRANGPVPSTYDTPAVFMSFSQGVGFGIRPYDQGGVGVLLDVSGNDRYEGGEFSQGGGYYYGVGVLHDGAGDDLYYGNRYAQGFACHQAAGLLTDLSGNDTYWAMTAAAQGAAWDQSVAMLFDGTGDDHYRAESLAQGAAAEQARAWLFDVQGNDVYAATAVSAQGAAADNSYHFREDDPVVSLGMLVDGAGADRYSSGLADGATRIQHAPANPDMGGGNAGVALDLAP